MNPRRLHELQFEDATADTHFDIEDGSDICTRVSCHILEFIYTPSDTEIEDFGCDEDEWCGHL